MLTVTNLKGESFVAEAQIPRTRIIGDREISLSFLHSDINDEFLSDIETGWTAEFQGDEYWLYNPREDKHGNKQFEGLLHFIREGNKIWHIDEVEDKSMTIQDSIGPLIAGMPDYTLNIIDNFYANTMSYSNRQTTTERFLYFISRHDAEFDIPIGSKTIRVVNEVGTYRDDLLIHEDDNLLDFQLDTQSASFCTSVVGYYDFDEEGIPQKSVKFTSELVEKYGDIPGEPILDDRYNDEMAVYEAARKRQESTYQVSFTVASELFDAPVNPGDYVPVVLPSKSINMYLRAVEVNELFDEEGELIDGTYSFGNENIASLYRDLQYDAQMDISDMLNGKKPLPPSVFPKAMQRAYEIIIGDNDSVMDYRKDRLTGWHSKDAGNAVEMNVSGLVFIRGGEPRSAITYEGVVTEALTAGTIDTNRIKIVGAEGHFYIDGDELVSIDYDDPEKFTKIGPGTALFSKNITILRYDGDPYIVDGQPLFEIPIVTKTNMDEGVTFGNRSYETSNDDFSLFETGYTSHSGRWANFVFQPGLRWDSRSTSAFMEVEVSIENAPEGVNVDPVIRRQIVYRDSPNNSFVLNIRLPRVTYGALSFLLKFRVDSGTGDNFVMIRSARCWISG